MIKKSLGALIAFVVVFVAGCGVTHSPIPQAVTVERLISDGWNLYDNGAYEAAAAKFDSAISINVLNVEAHLGYAWSENMLGNLKESRSYFKILEIAAFGATCTPLKIDSNIVVTHEATTWGDTVHVLRVHSAPILKIFKIVANDRSTYKPIYIGYDEIWLDTLPTNDTFRVYYFAYRPDVVVDSVRYLVGWGYSGYGASYLDDNTGDEDEAVYGIKTAELLVGDDTVSFAHAPYLNMQKLKALEALAFFRWGLYKNTVDILVNDFGWTDWDPTYDPFDIERRVMILQKLEEVMRNSGQ